MSFSQSGLKCQREIELIKRTPQVPKRQMHQERDKRGVKIKREKERDKANPSK